MRNIYAILFFLVFSFGYGQNQTIFRDPSFQVPKLAHVNIRMSNLGVEMMQLKSLNRQSDGKLLATGNFEMYDGKFSQQLVRINQDGTFDSTFHLEGTESFNIIYNAVALPNGKIILIANSASLGTMVLRLNQNGSLDSSFAVVNVDVSVHLLGIRSPFSKVKIQPDGKIAVAVESGVGQGTVNGIPFKGFFRLNENGTLDTAFMNTYNSFRSASSVTDFELLADGRIVLCGSITNASNQVKSVVLLNGDGTEDIGFSTGSNFGDSTNSFVILVEEVEVSSNQKIVCSGKFDSYNSIPAKNFIRLNLDGSIDNSFNAGVGFNTVSPSVQIFDMKIDANDKLIVSGNFLTYQDTSIKSVFRINVDGTIDTSFDFQPVNSTDINSATRKLICFDSNQDFFVSGDYNNFGTNNRINGLVKVNSSGGYLPSFSIGTGLTNVGVVNKVAELANGKIVIAGQFSYVNGQEKHGIALLNNDGTIDASFGGIGYGFDSQSFIKTFVIQPDGKILVGGIFSSYNGVAVKSLVRLNGDGSIDQSFNNGGAGFSGVGSTGVYDLQLQSNGKIVAVGIFNFYNSVTNNKIVRINTDGTLDASFIVGQGFNGSSYYDETTDVIRIQPDGKLLIAGKFTKYKNVSSNGFIRLNQDGSRDLTFATSQLSTAGPKFIGMFPNGDFLSPRSVSAVMRLAKTFSDGSHDPSFVSYSRSFYAVNDFLIQPDNKLIIAGTKGLYQKNLYRLNDDGSSDLSFNVGDDFELKSTFDTKHGEVFLSAGAVYSAGPKGVSVQSLCVQSDGKVLAGGLFSHYAGEEVSGLVRLINIPSYNLKGENRLDLSNNGCDAADPKFANLNFNVSSSNDDFTYVTNSTGNFNLGLTAGEHTITPAFENPTYFTASPSNITVDFPTQVSPLVQNFCITPNGNHPDLEVTLLPITPARPGFDAKYKLVYKNKGNQVQTGSVTLTFNDAVLDVVSSVPAASTQAVNTRSWDFTNLNPYETREVVVSFNLNTPTETPPLNGGSVLNYTATISSAQTDETPNDNTFSVNQTVVNSYDPNDKTCLQGTTVGTDKIGEYVHYVIRFENTGSYYAQNIVVTDFIDTNKFDITTLVPLNGSHLYTTKISQGNKVEFVFEDISLPYADATNDGYVAFKIKTKPTLVSGDTFTNGASIYFDYNYPIVTNTYSTTIQALSTQDFSFVNYFSLYPNPVAEVLNISKKSDVELQSIEIYNNLGQIVIAIPNAKGLSQIDVSNLSSGTYFVKVNSDKGTSNTKFIKK